jgi:hypothetical protein
VDSPVVKRTMPICASVVLSLVPGFGDILDGNIGCATKSPFEISPIDCLLKLRASSSLSNVFVGASRADRGSLLDTFLQQFYLLP